jgi:hypothetical protein
MNLVCSILVIVLLQLQVVFPLVILAAYFLVKYNGIKLILLLFWQRLVNKLENQTNIEPKKILAFPVIETKCFGIINTSHL